jgi:hypothetical protein
VSQTLGVNLFQELKKAREGLKTKSSITFIVAWVIVYFSISAMLVFGFGVFEKFDSIPSLVIVILIFLLLGILGGYLMFRFSVYVVEYILRDGVRRVFLKIGLIAFLLARLLGVASALEPTNRIAKPPKGWARSVSAPTRVLLALACFRWRALAETPLIGCAFHVTEEISPLRRVDTVEEV